jgi:hypothetical protein
MKNTKTNNQTSENLDPTPIKISVVGLISITLVAKDIYLFKYSN